MSRLRDQDPVEWSNIHLNSAWTAERAAGLLDKTSLTKLVENFHLCVPQVKIRVMFLALSVTKQRALSECKDEFIALCNKAGEDDDPWIQALGQMMQQLATTSLLTLASDLTSKPVRSAVQRVVQAAIDAKAVRTVPGADSDQDGHSNKTDGAGDVAMKDGEGKEEKEGLRAPVASQYLPYLAPTHMPYLSPQLLPAGMLRAVSHKHFTLKAGEAEVKPFVVDIEEKPASAVPEISRSRVALGSSGQELKRLVPGKQAMAAGSASNGGTNSSTTSNTTSATGTGQASRGTTDTNPAARSTGAANDASSRPGALGSSGERKRGSLTIGGLREKKAKKRRTMGVVSIEKVQEVDDAIRRKKEEEQEAIRREQEAKENEKLRRKAAKEEEKRRKIEEKQRAKEEKERAKVQAKLAKEAKKKDVEEKKAALKKMAESRDEDPEYQKLQEEATRLGSAHLQSVMKQMAEAKARAANQSTQPAGPSAQQHMPSLFPGGPGGPGLSASAPVPARALPRGQSASAALSSLLNKSAPVQPPPSQVSSLPASDHGPSEPATQPPTAHDAAQAAQVNNLVASLRTVTQGMKRLIKDEELSHIEDFLYGRAKNPNPAKQEALFKVSLEKVSEGGKSFWEIVLFEINYATGQWRRIRRRKEIQ